MTSDARMIEALRAGDENAFASLVDSYSSSLLRVARAYVGSRAVAEEVVQETWLGVIKGLDRFEGRCSLKTWIFRILTNTATTRGQRERRMLPLASLAGDEPRYPNRWSIGPAPLGTPEDGLLSSETREVIVRAIADLPDSQRAVVTLRDVEGWPAQEVCDLLAVSEVNQRVLLHRGRTKLRLALEQYFDATEATVPAAA